VRGREKQKRYAPQTVHWSTKWAKENRELDNRKLRMD